MLHGYVVNYLILSFFQAEAPNVVSALPITFMFRKGIEACWVLTRKIERKEKQTVTETEVEETPLRLCFVRGLKPVEFCREK